MLLQLYYQTINQAAKQAAATVALQAKQAAANALPITWTTCRFLAVNFEQMYGHVLGHLASVQAQPAAQPSAPFSRKLVPFKRPSIGTCCKRADWANFLAAW